MPTVSTNRSPLIIGHRGTSAVAPENTMAAFKLAIDSGADGIEFDVRLTRDNVPVIIHDETLLRTGGVSRRISESRLDEINMIDIGSWFRRTKERTTIDFSIETIPTLTQLFEWSETNSAKLYLEMKPDPDRRMTLAESVSSLVREYHMRDRVIIESFDLESLKLIKGLDSSLKTAALFEPSLATPPRIRSQHLIGLAKDSDADQLALHHRLANQHTIDLVHKAGFEVVVWTVDDPKWVSIARTLNISAVITNNPSLLLAQRDNLPAG